MSVEGTTLLEQSEPFVLADGKVNLDYHLGTIVSESEEGGPSVRVIFVGELEARLLVCIPGTAWHRKTVHRSIPTKFFQKPAKVSVSASSEDDRKVVDDAVTLPVWLGFLSPELALLVEVSTLADEVDVDFLDGRLPHAEALQQLAQDHFSFFSANETGPASPEEAGGSGSQDLSSRMSQIELVMEDIQQTLMALNGPQPQVDPVRPQSKAQTTRPSALKKTPTAAKQETKPVVEQPVVDYPDLDPGVVTAALQAGIPHSSLAEMQMLMGKNVKGARALRQDRPTKLASVLSESEDKQAEGGSPPETQGDPMQLAVSKLTEIMGHLTHSHQKKGRSKLDLALDGAAPSSADSSTNLGVKKSAMARRALRSSLHESPEDIYGLVERLMAEDMFSQTLPPGVSAPSFTSRSWIEHRSHIGAWKSLAHAAWGVGGILDCLRLGQTAAARARCCLLLLQLDQSAVDKGQWRLAAELSLEAPPPFNALSQHQSPNVLDGEMPYSRLLDPRWAELAVSHIKDTDDYLLKRGQLGRRIMPTAEVEDTSERKAKAKPKAKAQPES